METLAKLIIFIDTTQVMNNKIKVFHEVPFELLELSRDFTDGDYCLPHLMNQDEIYRNYFYDSKQQGRYIIMDNSLHELGTAYDTDRLLFWINELKPNEFIVPDVWENTTQSIVNARKWSQIKSIVTGKQIGRAHV